MLWFMAGEALSAGIFGEGWTRLDAADWAAALSPRHAMLAAVQPLPPLAENLPFGMTPVGMFVAFSLILAVLLNGCAILRIRAWNPSQEARPVESEADEAATDAATDVHAAPGRSRTVWDNPILWREVRTKAYGKKIIAVRLAYLAVFAICAVALFGALLAGSRAAVRQRSCLPRHSRWLLCLCWVCCSLTPWQSRPSRTNATSRRSTCYW